MSVDQAATAAMQLGQGALLAKTDIKAAYRLIPVHTQNSPNWACCGKMNCTLMAFGLRSVPKIFSAVADALEWCVGQRRVEYIFHYLDDFLTMGPPDSSMCEDNLQTLERLCVHLGVPLAPDKREGPSPVLVFLGIVIDTSKENFDFLRTSFKN